MDPKTFQKLWFAWASCQNHDFVMPDPYCGWNPSCLGGDGTRMGIAISKAIISPIEKREGSPLETPNRRLDRCFITSAHLSTAEARNAREARDHLRHIANVKLGNVREPYVDCESKNENLFQYIPEPTRDLLSALMNDQLPSLELLHSVGRVFLLLSHEASLCQFLPITILSHMVDFIHKPSEVPSFLDELDHYNPDFATFLRRTVVEYGDQWPSYITSFLQHIVDRVRNLEEHMVVPEVPAPIPGSYNPPKYGRFYYFRSDGKQVRRGRPFSIDDKNTAKQIEFDDVPYGPHCRKFYPKVSAKGSTYMFFWFCPLHGHCFGGHMISGSEGRKDPHFSLYKHIESAPKKIFYDFACSLSEYAGNRESGFFKSSSFYHDIFHGVGHICSPVFKASRLRGIDAMNTSICEQFNAFLQCIKEFRPPHEPNKFHVLYTVFCASVENQKKKSLSFKCTSLSSCTRPLMII